MSKTETFTLLFENIETEIKGVPVVIVAAGSSSRMMGADKQFSCLGGIPVLARTLRAFENCSCISEITVVTREEKIADITKLGERYAVSKLKNVVVGGKSREESVLRGIELYEGNCEKILVHDGARPLVTETIIKEVVNALQNHDSVTCAVKPKDTVKQVNEDGMVTDTLNRNMLVTVQTPQGVNVNKFIEVAKTQPLENFTDDTSVIEFLGINTKITQGDYTNIKITTPEDLLVAEEFIRKEW